MISSSGATLLLLILQKFYMSIKVNIIRLAPVLLDQAFGTLFLLIIHGKMSIIRCGKLLNKIYLGSTILIYKIQNIFVL